MPRKLEYLIDPHAFLQTCYAILKPSGYMVLVLPDGGFYCPNGHPFGNPDHRWWMLTPEKVIRWARHAFADPKLEPVFRHDATACEGTLWSFVLVFQK